MNFNKWFDFTFFIKNNIRLMRYIFLVINVFFMLGAVKIYINYQNVIEEINKANLTTKEISDNYSFFQNYLHDYLNSEYSVYFKSHENEMLFEREYMVNLVSPFQAKAVTEQAQTKTVSNDIFDNIHDKDKTSKQKRSEYLNLKFGKAFN